MAPGPRWSWHSSLTLGALIGTVFAVGGVSDFHSPMVSVELYWEGGGVVPCQFIPFSPGFTVLAGTSVHYSVQVLNSYAPPWSCILLSLWTPTPGFSITDANLPYQIPYGGLYWVNFSIQTPDHAGDFLLLMVLNSSVGS